MTLGNDNGTDGQTDRRTDRVRRNMRPPPREEGRIIIMERNSRCVIKNTQIGTNVEKIIKTMYNKEISTR